MAAVTVSLTVGQDTLKCPCPDEACLEQVQAAIHEQWGHLIKHRGQSGGHKSGPNSVSFSYALSDGSLSISGSFSNVSDATKRKLESLFTAAKSHPAVAAVVAP